MNLAALPVTRATHGPEMPFVGHQRKSQRSTLVVVISGDGELVTSAPSSVAGEMLPVRAASTIAVTLMIYYRTNKLLNDVHSFNQNRIYC